MQQNNQNLRTQQSTLSDQNNTKRVSFDIQNTPKIQQPSLTQVKKLGVLVISQVLKDRIDNQQSVDITNYAIKKLSEMYAGFEFFSFNQQKDQFPSTLDFCKENRTIDYVLTIGANSTLMYTFYKFEDANTPPILAFSVEGESTLFNFTKCDIDIVLKRFVQKIKTNKIQKCIEKFSKLQFVKDNIIKNFTCDIQIHRGLNPGLVKMQLFIKNSSQQEQIFISRLWGDGLVISTAYGSVTRSMVLNGPIIHKKLQSLIITPVCPLSLKFRPIVLPTDCDLIIKFQQNSRAGGTIFLDGVNTNIVIKPGEQIVIRKSPLKTSMVSDLNGSYQRILFQNLQQFLSWGEQFSSLQYKKSPIYSAK